MKKFIILTSLLAMNVQGMPENLLSHEHVRICSTPGGLWSLEEEYYTHYRALSTPPNFKLSVNRQSENLHPKKIAENPCPKKRKSSNFKKRINEKPFEIFKLMSKSEPELHESINSVRQNVIEAQNQKQKTDQNVKKVLKKKRFEKRFTNFLGNNVGKFVADKLFDLLTFRDGKRPNIEKKQKNSH